ncbi:hypothetical protein MRB53_006824 [Persea americana]|uniref:Uncharacterized protein n=1 Tax=Persea americana TaxID=3435 RepID=A0ACC2MHH2_PERAE|nr:hypothetical protein MRB53_006824 [Persea americana]
MPQLKQIHAQLLKTSPSIHPYHTVFLYSRIFHFYASSDLSYAARLLDHAIDNTNSFIWNTLIRAYARSPEHKFNSLVLYRRMLIDGRILPDKFTFPFVLKACAFLFANTEGRQIHAQVFKMGFQADTHVGNSLIHFYTSCGCLDDGRRLFDRMLERSVVSWNVTIDGYVRWGEFDTAIGLFREMQEKSFAPDQFTMQSLVCACAGLAALSIGMWSHVYVIRRCAREVAGDVLISNSLIDMYMKCGSLDMACQVFKSMPQRDVASWNALILGFAMHGHVQEALDAFACMCTIAVLKPNSITFVGILSACSHGGLVNEGRRFFYSMVAEYNIEPQVEHYGCMVNLLSRSGFMDEALDLISVMPIKPDVVIWRSLLDCCCKQNASIEVSESLAKQALESEGGVSSGVYVLLSRVYASAERWNDVGLVRRLMGEIGIKKEPGCSSMEMDGTIHEFMAGDTSHLQSKEIYEMLKTIEDRLASIGYKPDLSQASMIADVDDGRQHSLRLHGERLAIAFGLLNMKKGTPIRIFKNLRVCNDCHNVIKLISKVFDVEIIVRDRIRFHRFRDGSCSCMDYW